MSRTSPLQGTRRRRPPPEDVGRLSRAPPCSPGPGPRSSTRHLNQARQEASCQRRSRSRPRPPHGRARTSLPQRHRGHLPRVPSRVLSTPSRHPQTLLLTILRRQTQPSCRARTPTPAVARVLMRPVIRCISDATRARERPLTGISAGQGPFSMVGDTGFEPVTSSVSRKRATAAPIAQGVVRVDHQSRGGDGI